MGFFGSPPPAADNDNTVTGGLSVTGGTSTDTLDVSSTLTVTGATALNGGLNVTGGASWTGNGSSGGTDFEIGLNDTSRGTPGTSGHYRALVKETGNVLVINYGGDFTGGVEIQGSSVKIDGTVTNGLTVTGGITVDSITGSGNIGVTDPNNTLASVNLEFINDMPCIRYGGSGTGSANGFSVIGAGNVTKWSVDNSGNMTVYNNLVFSNSVNQITGLQKIYSAGGAGVTFEDKLIMNSAGESIRIIGSGTTATNAYIAWYESNNSTRSGWIGYGSSTNNNMTLYNSVGGVFTMNNTLDDGSGNMTLSGALIATSSAESHFANNGAYVDPQSGASRAIKASGGIATDYIYISGNVSSYGNFYVNGCPHIQMAYVTIPNNGSGGYKWTFPTAIPSASGCNPLINLNIVPGTQYFMNSGNNSRTSCTYYHSSSGSLSGWIFEVQQ